MKKKRNYTTFFLIIILLVGLSLLLYPTVSDYWNTMHQSQAISAYAAQVAELDTEQYDALWQASKEYNAKLANRTNAYLLDDALKEEYKRVLTLSGTDVMGYVEIPELDCTLPIYHGTEEAILQVAVGHLEWTSLPTGGESTHCVLSGHRGLPSAKLFSDLGELVVGDVFMLRVLDEVLTYEVDQILIVEPQDTAALRIEEDHDFCTLVTCTPYGVNTHRLLVRGHRIENAEESRIVRVTADAVQIEPLLAAPILAIPVLLVLLISLLRPRKTEKDGGKNYEIS